MKIELLTTKEIADKFRVTRQTVYNWRKEGCPVFISSQKTMRYDLDAVMRWLRKRKDK